jgi:thioredoxin reductase (NADPH)
LSAPPGGLTTSIYLACFRPKVAIIDSGFSRASLFPASHNCPGFPEGVSGKELRRLFRLQAAHFGIEVQAGQVSTLKATEKGFEAIVERAAEPGRSPDENRMIMQAPLYCRHQHP